MQCTKCGNPVPSQAKFCINCGQPAGAPPETPHIIPTQTPAPPETPPQNQEPPASPTTSPPPAPYLAPGQIQPPLLPYPPPPPKKKGGVIAISIIAIVGVLALIGFGIFAVITLAGNFLRTDSQIDPNLPEPTPIVIAPTVTPTPPPAPLTNLTGITGPTISAGGDTGFAILPDGTLWAWGGNIDGQLGDGSYIDRSNPVRILDNIVTISAGGDHSMAIDGSGDLWTWGLNSHGQLGDGSATDRNTPMFIPVLEDAEVTAVAAGENHSLVLTNHCLFSWGANSFGQLGDGSFADSRAPLHIKCNIVAISAGGSHSLAIDTDGNLWAWGDNLYGQLGTGDWTDSNVPVRIMGDVVVISAGESHSMAIRNDGSLWTWGNNWDGQLGDGTFEDSNAPIHIMDDVAAVSAGHGWHSLAIRTDGTLWAWGNNWDMQLGRSVSEEYNAPIHIMDNVAQVSGGGWHTIATRNDGSLWTWGWNANGQLGTGTFTNYTAPRRIKDSIMPSDHSVVPHAAGILPPPIATPSPYSPDNHWDDDWDTDNPFWWIWDYIFRDSDSRYLTNTDVDWLNLDELRLARNEILARHGRLFDSPDMQEHFDSMDWYHGHIAPEDFDYDVLNHYERTNIEFIREWEARHQ